MRFTGKNGNVYSAYAWRGEYVLREYYQLRSGRWALMASMTLNTAADAEDMARCWEVIPA